MCENARYIDLPLDGLGPHPLAPVAALTSMPAEASGTAAETRTSRARRKLWDIPHKYHCPVIGTCIHIHELRRLAQRMQCRPNHELSDYDVHVSFVAAVDQKNALSQALHRFLDRKHAGAVRRFAQARTPDALERLWDEALAEGQVQGALWAVMTHPRASGELRARVYEDVHMLSHQIGAGLSADLEALADARELLAQVRRDSAAEAARAARRLAERDARIKTLEGQLEASTGAEQALAAATARVAALEADGQQQRLRTLEQQVEALGRREQAARGESEELRRRAEAAEARCDALAEQLRMRERDLQALEGLLTAAPSHGDDCGCDGDRCLRLGTESGGPDLGGRRILCVGGRDSLSSRYRDVVERCNGELIRYDGGVEDNRQRLEALLASADAVVCPADCVSHDAYQRAKRYCKRTAKPCVLLDRSGVGAFAWALAQLTGAAPAASPQSGVRVLQPT